jgi:uncharacterized phosphosugar-binding protein
MLERLSWIVTEQIEPINAAALAVADAIAAGHRVWIAETSHGLHDEVTFRAGGLMAVHRLNDPVGIEAGDVVVVPTNAGTTQMTVDFALIGKERGATTVALTQVDYEMDSRLTPEHASGKRLSEVAGIVVDLGGRYGDTELDFVAGNRTFAAIPGSGIAGMLAMWMIFAEATELLCRRGAPPLIWDSMQMPGVHPENLKRYAAYRHSRLGIEPAP